MKRRFVLWLVPLIVLAGLLLTMTGAHALEQRPLFCASCHEEQINYQTWLASGAAEHHPTCIECHVPAGPYGALRAQARGVTHLVKHITGQYTEPLRGSVPGAWCAKCHTENARLEREHHEAPRFGTASCAECHNHRPGVRFEGEEEHGRGEREREGRS